MRLDAEFFGEVSVGAAVGIAETGRVAIATGLKGSVIARMRGFRSVNCGAGAGRRRRGTRKCGFQNVRELAHLLGSKC